MVSFICGGRNNSRQAPGLSLRLFISYASDCPLCSTFFRKIIIDAGEKPEALELTPSEQKIIDFGSSIAKHHGNIADHVYDAVASHFDKTEMTVLIAFAGQMIATNVFQ
jgi:hypothetical protein